MPFADANFDMNVDKRPKCALGRTWSLCETAVVAFAVCAKGLAKNFKALRI